MTTLGLLASIRRRRLEQERLQRSLNLLLVFFVLVTLAPLARVYETARYYLSRLLTSRQLRGALLVIARASIPHEPRCAHKIERPFASVRFYDYCVQQGYHIFAHRREKQSRAWGAVRRDNRSCQSDSASQRLITG